MSKCPELAHKFKQYSASCGLGNEKDMWKGSGDRVPFYLVKSGSAHSVLQMTIYGSGDRVLFYSIM